MDTTDKIEQPVRGVRRGRPRNVPTIDAADLPGCDKAAAEYAARVWNGQSPDVAVTDRIARVIAALRGQGLVIDAVIPLHPDAARYMEAHK